jgi:hypothetical protein
LSTCGTELAEETCCEQALLGASVYSDRKKAGVGEAREAMSAFVLRVLGNVRDLAD